MVFASCCGEYNPPDTPTLADLLTQSRTALGCAILLLAVALVMGIIYRRDGWRFWPRKTVLFSVATTVLALAIAKQTWSLHQSFIQDGLSQSATYSDIYHRMGAPAADRLDLAVGTFGMWSVALVLATLTLLCVIGAQLITSLRSRRQNSREVIHTIGLPPKLPLE